MPKPLLYIIVAALPLLLAALVLGRTRAPRGCEPHAVTTTRSTVHVRAAQHASSRNRTTIDDDDESDDDDDVETAMLAPRPQPKSDVAPDTAGKERAASAGLPAFTTTVAALRMTGRGIRPSGEHRSAADKPPRS